MNNPKIDLDNLQKDNAQLRYALKIAARTLKQAQESLESDGARYTWIDAPIDIANEALSIGAR